MSTNKPHFRPVQPDELNTLTKKCHHYSVWDEVPHHLRKYWQQRYSIFSLYDQGIAFTDDAWFGVTPEPVADTIAHTLAKSSPTRTTIVDLFAGVGGNAIAFARATPHRWQRIIAVEFDADTLACARHNAAVHGVSDLVTWVHGDCLEFLDQQYSAEEGGDETSSSGSSTKKMDPALRLKTDETVLFASPPWGGPTYRGHDVFDLDTMEPYNLETLEYYCQDMPHALYLPRTSDVRQIADLVENDREINVTQYCMNGASKALVAYIPQHSLLSKSADSQGTNGDEEGSEDPFREST